jgi:hypothetical protein
VGKCRRRLPGNAVKHAIPKWEMLTIGGMAVVAGGALQAWPLLCFGVGLMGSTTIASAMTEDER